MWDVELEFFLTGTGIRNSGVLTITASENLYYARTSLLLRSITITMTMMRVPGAKPPNHPDF